MAAAAGQMLRMALVALAVAAGGCAGGSGTDDAAAIRETFAAYHAALATRDGRRALALVDRGTVAWYDEARKLALHAPPERVRALPLTQRLQVLMLRHLLDYRSVSQMSGADVLRFLVEQGYASGAPPGDRAGLAEFRIEGDRARAVLHVRERATPIVWGFRREDGRWKIDLTSVLPLAASTMAIVADRSGLTEDEFLLEVLERRTGRPATEAIWSPLGQALAQ